MKRHLLLVLGAIAVYVFVIIHLARLQDNEFEQEMREMRSLVELMNAVDAVQQ